MAKSKGINIPVKLDTKATTRELKTLTDMITKSIGKINAGNKQLTQSVKQSTIALNKQNTALKRENKTLNKNTTAWKKNTQAQKQAS